MPYITVDRREALTLTHSPLDAGELNYMITKVILDYWKREAKTYQRINDILGAMEGAKLEFNRRVVEDYENTKANKNGDVY